MERKMRTLKISLLVFILSITISAQWEWRNPKPQANNLKKIYFSDTTTGWMVGSRGTFLRITEASDWEVKYFAGVQSDLTSLTFRGKNLGWAVSAVVGVVEEGRVFKTSDGGQNWEQVSIFNKDLYDVKFVSDDIGWVVGFGIISKTTDGGNSWNNQLLDPTGRFYTCYFADSLKGWAVGYVGTEIYHTEDGGLTWYNQNLNPAGTYFSISFADSGNAWIVGHTLNGNYYASVFRSSDGGLSWFDYPLSGAGLTNITFINDSLGWIADRNGNILNTLDGGNNWSNIASLGSSIQNFFFINSKDGYLINPGGIIRRTNDGGYTWLSQSSGFRFSIGSAFFVDSIRGTILTPSAELWYTQDGAKTWTVSHQPPYTDFLYKINFVDSLFGWACGLRYFPPPGLSGSLILKTTNGGQSWSAHTPSEMGVGYHLSNIRFIDRQTGFTGRYDIWKTTNGGSNWNNVQSVNGLIFDIFFVNGTTGWVSSGDGKIYKSTDTGNSWNLIGSGQDSVIYSICFIDEERGWAGGWGGLFMSTTDGGFTWQKHNFGQGEIKSIVFKDQDNGWAFGSKTIHTTDGGQTWQSYWIPTEYSVNSVQFVNDKLGWFTGDGGAILKYFKDEPSFIETEEFEIEKLTFSLSQNYPNPFNPVTKIKYTIPTPPVSSPLVKGRTKEGFVTLKVYDILGREISTLVNEEKPAGEYEVGFDGTALTSGIYFYQLRAGQFTETKKMILLK
jgi:photosystem II stability/assembly factor-like uncharacterized protein